MSDAGTNQTDERRTEPPIPSSTPLAARLFSAAIALYAMLCIAEFVFITREFGFKNAIALSILSLLPFLLSVSMRVRWKSVKGSDWGALALLLVAMTLATIVLVDRWYKSGWHYRPGTWTFVTPQSEEDRNWDAFLREVRKEPAFKRIKSRRFRGVNWLEGTLESMADLDRLIALARKCGINDRRLDGPYRHSISITIPGTTRDETSH